MKYFRGLRAWLLIPSLPDSTVPHMPLWMPATTYRLLLPRRCFFLLQLYGCYTGQRAHVVFQVFYTGQRAHVVFQVFMSKGDVGEPAQVKWSHVMFVSIGFVLPVAFCTYIVYLVACGLQLDSIRVGELVQAEYSPAGDDVQDKLEAGRLIRYYEVICETVEDQEELDRVWLQIEVREADDVKNLVRGITTSVCLRERLSDEELSSEDIRDLLDMLRQFGEQPTPSAELFPSWIAPQRDSENGDEDQQAHGSSS